MVKDSSKKSTKKRASSSPCHDSKQAASDDDQKATNNNSNYVGNDHSQTSIVEPAAEKHSFDLLGWLLFLVIVAVSIFTCPDLVISQKVTINQVWYYGWITAVSTGLGVVPFYFVSQPNQFWMGISNGKQLEYM